MNGRYRAFATILLAATFSVAASAAGFQNDEISWVLFYGNPERPTSGGNAAAEALARQAQQALGKNFMVWFKLDGKSYVSEDRATMDRISQLMSQRVTHGWMVINAERTRQENAEYADANSPLIEGKAAELRQLGSDLQKMAAGPLTATQDVSDLLKRTRAMVDTLWELQSQIVNRESRIRSLRVSEDRFRQLGSERQIFSEAIASGKAQPAP